MRQLSINLGKISTIARHYPSFFHIRPKLLGILQIPLCLSMRIILSLPAGVKYHQIIMLPPPPCLTFGTKFCSSKPILGARQIPPIVLPQNLKFALFRKQWHVFKHSAMKTNIVQISLQCRRKLTGQGNHRRIHLGLPKYMSNRFLQVMFAMPSSSSIYK